jgi:hypothetical protein
MYTELGSLEDAANRTMSGTDVRLCYHVDRTVTSVSGLTRAECDYCPAWAIAPGALPDIAPSLLRGAP